MAENEEFKIKGAARAVAVKHIEAKGLDVLDYGEETSVANPLPSSPGQVSEREEPEAKTDDTGTKREDHQSHEEQVRRYRWCKCICDTTKFGRDHYFLNMDTQESSWEEPPEPFWLWDAEKQTLDDNGLQYPAVTSAQTASDEIDPEYTGYNPKIHGSYDPNAPYAQYHDKKREEEAGVSHIATGMSIPAPSGEYATTGTFNRFTGNFQGGEKSAELHSDLAKSGRQMGSYFDVDAAANAHDGRSLKEERRNEKLSKKQIKELAEKRRAKKEKKRMDFYKS